MNIIFLNRFYWPDEPATAQLLRDLAEALAKRGHSVAVIASQPPGAGIPREASQSGVRIIRVGGTRWGRRSLAGRAVDFACFLLAASWRLAWVARRGDVVIAMTDPPLLGIAVALVARLKGAACWHWVQDIYPEIAVALSPGPFWKVTGAGLRAMRNATWRRAAGCVTLGQDMATTVASAGVPAARIAVIPNWAPAGLEAQPVNPAHPLRQAWGLQDKFVVAYSGNLGRVHDLDPILRLAAALHNHPRIVIVFIGDGAQRSALQRQVAVAGLTNVRFQPAQPRERLAETLALGDLHLVTLHPRCAALVFPSKLYGIAAVGRPMLFVGPRNCEVARLVSGEAMGAAFTRVEIRGMADAVQAMAAQPDRWAAAAQAAAAYSARTGRLEHALASWAGLLEGMPLAEDFTSRLR